MLADYQTFDALGLADLVRRGQVSAEELLETAIARLEAVDPVINAISQRLYDHGRQAIAAGLPDGPFAGVPFLLKDVSLMLRGQVTTQGARLFRDFVAESDSTLTERYKRAGLVIFGKTTTPEFGLAASTETTLTGSTRNPWDPTRTAGGSSGGAAAAVAAGIVPAAHGSDGGGSIRIPAAACGLFGLKPTRARIPAGPFVGEGWGGLATNHVLTRTVRDSAAFLDATHGPAPGDPYAAPPAPKSFLTEADVAPGRLRIAVQTRPYADVPVAPDCLAAVDATAALLRDLGHEVDAAQPPGDWETLGWAIWVLVASNVSLTLRTRGRARGRPVEPGEVERVTWSAVEYARSLTVEDYPAALAIVHRHGRQMAAFHQHWDLLLSPTLAQPAVPLGPQHMDNPDLEQYRQALIGFSPFTSPHNMSGAPSASLPLHWTKGELPVGVMLTGRFGEDARLLQVSRQLEAARPWHDRRPRLAA